MKRNTVLALGLGIVLCTGLVLLLSVKPTRAEDYDLPAQEAAMHQANAEVQAIFDKHNAAVMQAALEKTQPELDVPATDSIETPTGYEAVARYVGNGCSGTYTYSTIAAALAAAGTGDTIYLEGGRIFNEFGLVMATDDLTIRGGYNGCATNSSASTTIDAGGSGRGMWTSGSVDLTLEDIKFVNGSISGSGGGLRFAWGSDYGTLTLDNVEFSYNDAEDGGGLYVGRYATVNGTSVTIRHNSATDNGGGLYLAGATANFYSSNIYTNTAPAGAGAYVSLNGVTSSDLNLLSGADIYENAALTGVGCGGGVMAVQSTVDVYNSSDIRDNDGDWGAGIYMISSTLTINSAYSEIEHNVATTQGGGIWAVGSTINLEDRAELQYNFVTGGGGGAYLDNSDLVSTNSNIEYNQATSHGGGVYLTKGATLEMDIDSSCTSPRCSQLSDNSSGTSGGGAFVEDSGDIDLRRTWVEQNTAQTGGGIYLYTGGTAELHNTLLAENDATIAVGDGIRVFNAFLDGTHNTFAYNDAGGAATGRAIDIGGTGWMNMSNSIIWGHASSINTTSETISCSNIEGGYPAGTNIRNDNPLFVDAANDDYHLTITSSLLDRCATGDGPDFDNHSRPVTLVRPSTPYDMGADEGGARIGINGGGCEHISLQEAIDDASPGDSIQMSLGTFYETVVIDKNLTITGGYDYDCSTTSTNSSTLNGESTDEVVEVTTGTVQLEQLVLREGSGTGGGLKAGGSSRITLVDTNVNNNAANIGGGIYVGPNAAVTTTQGSLIYSNAATSAGGGVYVAGEFVALHNESDIYQNSAPDGAGIYILTGEIRINSADLYGNTATGNGGGIYAEDSTVTLENSTFVYFDNTAANGAGIFANNSDVSLSNTYIRGNIASDFGGGIYLGNGSTLSGHGFIGQYTSSSENQARRGGGIYADQSTVDISGDVVGNEAYDYGAGIYANASTIILTDVELGRPDAYGPNYLTHSVVYGAGMYLTGGSQATLLRTDVQNNQVTGTPGFAYGLGIAINDNSSLTMTDSSLLNHSADATSSGHGAALLLYGTQATLDNCEIMSNTSSHDGGAISIINGGDLTVSGSLFQYNESTGGYGGAVALENTASAATFVDSQFYDNESQYGGAINALSDTEIACYETDFGAVGHGNTASSSPGSGGAITLNEASLFARNCTFTENSATGNGGAIAAYGSDVDINYDTGECNPTTTRCSVFSDNEADSDADTNGWGGAIYAFNTNLNINHTWMVGNEASRGGAIFQNGSSATGYIRNSLLYDNTSTEPYGAGIRNLDGTMTLNHVTLADNQGGAGYSQSGSTASADISNTIAWLNSIAGFVKPYVGSWTYSCTIDQSGNVGDATDPLFANSASNDFHLTLDSPAVNACSNGLGKDLESSSRPYGPAYDMGAFELQELPEPDSYEVFLPISMKE